MAEADAQSVKFFGARWTATTRNWYLYIKQIELRLETSEDATEIANLQKLANIGNAVRKVLGDVQKFGLQSEQATALYQQQIQWLAMQRPAIGNPFSVYFRRTMHIQQAADAWPASHFWSLVKDAALSGLLPSDEVAACQLELLSGKLLTLTQEDHQAELY